jgi:hypothetical protein
MKTKNPQDTRAGANDLKLVLVLAILHLFGAFVLLFISQPVIVFHQSYRWLPSGADGASPGMLHFYGFAGLVFSFLLFQLYFKARRHRRLEIERRSRRQ